MTRLGLGFLLLLSACGNVQAPPVLGPDYVAGELIRFMGGAQTPTGAWCWFQDERVIINDQHPDGRTVALYARHGKDNNLCACVRAA